MYVLLVPGWWLTPGFTCNIIQQARCSSLECCKFHNPIFQKWLSYTVTLTLSKLNKIESLERNVFFICDIFQVVWGGVAGGAGAFLWFLLTQVLPKTIWSLTEQFPFPYSWCSLHSTHGWPPGEYQSFSLSGKLRFFSKTLWFFPWRTIDWMIKIIAFRDTSTIPNIFWFEYVKIRSPTAS